MLFKPFHSSFQIYHLSLDDKRALSTQSHGDVHHFDVPLTNFHSDPELRNIKDSLKLVKLVSFFSTCTFTLTVASFHPHACLDLKLELLPCAIALLCPTTLSQWLRFVHCHSSPVSSGIQHLSQKAPRHYD